MDGTALWHRAEIVVDLEAIRSNVRVLRERIASPLMAVVKADAYGHGMVACARAAREAGATWLGVATLEEALALRQAGDVGPLLCWLHLPGEDYVAAREHHVDVTAYDEESLAEMTRVAPGLRVQLKIDTGLSRNGASAEMWPQLVALAAAAQHDGRARITGVWSHFATADDPGHPAAARQSARFSDAVAIVRDAGLIPEVIHIANSAGATMQPFHPDANLVRVGLATYGLDPAPTHPLGLRPAMTVRTMLARTRTLGAGEGVSYGHTYVADQPMTVGLVPVGYGDGIPRHASGKAQVWVDGQRCRVLGRVCMDQFVVDLTGTNARRGDRVIIFGPGYHGEPTAQDWAEAAETINYEIVTRIGGRMTRVYRG